MADNYHYRFRSRAGIHAIVNWGGGGALRTRFRLDQIPIGTFTAQRRWIYRNFNYHNQGRHWRTERMHALRVVDEFEELSRINHTFKELRYRPT